MHVDLGFSFALRSEKFNTISFTYSMSPSCLVYMLNGWVYFFRPHYNGPRRSMKTTVVKENFM
jgi:hypothetical protein